ncbi:MAG: ABC transporter permease [Chloroflexota bacterium]
MSRLATTLRWDIQLQFRNGFYYASAFVALITVLILGLFPNANWRFILPVILFENLLINTFYFIAALVLLEKGEGTLEGLIVSPLRKWEYLTSKIISLTLLSIFETVAITLIIFGASLNWPIFFLGIVILCAMFALIGFMFVARYDSINTFLFPSVAFTTLLSIPIISSLSLWDSPLLLLHPFQAPMLLLTAGFQAIPSWQILYGIIYGVLWIGVFYQLSQRAFYRFVILKQGVK